MPDFPALVLLHILGFVSYALFLLRKRQRGPLPYPPGPPPKPIVGNVFDIPFSQRPWSRYLEWSKRLNSDIVHMSAMTKHFVILHKLEDAVALFEKKSAIYSDRPVFPIAELMGVGGSSSVLPYGNRWRKHRKVFQETIGRDHALSYRRIQTKKVHQLLGELLRSPEKFAAHCKWLTASTTLATTFAYNVMPGQGPDHFIDTADFVGKQLAELSLPGRTLVNIFPFLGYIPPWVPGASTQKLLTKCKRMASDNKNELFDYVKTRVDDGTAEDCILGNLLRGRASSQPDVYGDEILKDVMATMYLAGVETTQGTLTTFILSMALHPEKQKRAQAEIDQVVGPDRLPTFDDRNSLPYVEAIYREVQRWRPIFPLGIPHTSIKDDVYRGFYVPKGTLVFSNIWAISRDEDRYRDPDSFVPERFFDEDGSLNNDTVNYVFGFGRRICPGKYLSDALVWLVLACMLSMFDIAKAKDEDGNEIDIDADAFADSFITHPLPFKCSIVPRSQHAEFLIRTAARNA